VADDTDTCGHSTARVRIELAEKAHMLIVAGLSLKNLHPRVWDPKSPYFLPSLQAVMVSYGEFHQMPAQMEKAKELGLRKYLAVPDHVGVYLDNGAFYFLRAGGQAERKAYQEFVEKAKPDWYPIAFDVIPTPQMSNARQRQCFDGTMDANRAHTHDGYVPVIHISRMLNEYVKAIMRNPKLAAKDRIALGAIVPNLLRAPKALSYATVLENLLYVRTTFRKKEMHIFGIGGTSTIHLAGLLDIDSVDSSGWRNRAARGIVQLPGSGDRMIANLGKWRGRAPSKQEWDKLRRCRCPACTMKGIRGLKADGLNGFCNRATHNLWVLLEEARWMEKHLRADTYANNYRRRLDNSTYLPLIKKVLEMKKLEGKAAEDSGKAPQWKIQNHTFR
jgi:7-cyano-7-deazaguanine tRNA-ribosyltransferase